jgi:hypothetical protein
VAGGRDPVVISHKPPPAQTIDALYRHWILGKQAGKRIPRWSIMRNVLHWLD